MIIDDSVCWFCCVCVRYSLTLDSATFVSRDIMPFSIATAATFVTLIPIVSTNINFVNVFSLAVFCSTVTYLPEPF